MITVDAHVGEDTSIEARQGGTCNWLTLRERPNVVALHFDSVGDIDRLVEALGVLRAQMGGELTGAEQIVAERQRQINAEGWSPEHDDAHADLQLAWAAWSYLGRTLMVPGGASEVAPAAWPWSQEDWKPTPDDPVRQLVKAGALIAAEIDRLQRSGASPVAATGQKQQDGDGAGSRTEHAGAEDADHQALDRLPSVRQPEVSA